MLNRSLNIAVVLISTGLAQAAQAVTFTGTTASGSTFNRPNANGIAAPTALSPYATTARYASQTLTVATSGLYDLSSIATASWDNYLVLYSGAFSASSPLTNVSVANDDDNGVIGKSGLLGVALTAGQTYTIVTTGSSNGDSGAFTNELYQEASLQSGTTSGGSTWDPFSSGAAISYASTAFTVDTAGNYNVLSSAGYDNFVALYADSFNPASPNTNLVTFNDDSSTSTRAGFAGQALTTGHTYYLVTTGTNAASAGLFSNTISGPGTVTVLPKTWTLTGSGTWSTATAWSAAGKPIATDSILLGSAIAADATITIDSGGTVAATTVNTTHTYTVALSGPTAFNAGTLTINSGTLAMASGGSNTLRASSLTIASGGKLDLANNSAIIDYSTVSPIASIRSLLATGQITGATTSSTAIGYSEASTLLGAAGGTFGNQSVSGNAVLLKLTLAGDADLDSTVSFSDLLALARSYGGTDTVWTQGDFNYSGTTDFNDLLSLARNYGQTLSADQSAQLDASFQSDWALAESLVPEPGMLCWLGLVKFATRRRRR